MLHQDRPAKAMSFNLVVGEAYAFSYSGVSYKSNKNSRT